MNLLDFAITPLWRGLGDGPRARRRGRRRARRVRADRARAAGLVPRRRRPRRRAARRRRSRRGWRPRPRTCGCATSRPMQALELRLEAARAASARLSRPGMSGGRSGVIEGGRIGRGAARACSIVGAAEIATLAGGVRRGPRAGRGRPAARGPSAGPGRARRAGRRVLGGPDRRGRTAGRRSRPRSRRTGYPLARFARLDAARRLGHARPGRPAHPPAVRRLARGRAGPAPAGAPPTSTSSRPAAGSSRRWPRPAPRRPTTCSPTAGAGSTRCSAHGVTTIEAKSGYGLDLETELRLLEVAYRLGARGPDRRRADVPRRARGRRRSSAPGRTAPRRTSARVIEEQLPGIAAHGRARFCDVFCEEGVFSADQSRRILDGGRRLRAGASPPRRRARPVRRRRARRRARGGVRRPPRDAVRRRDRRARRGRRRRTRRSSRRCCRRRPGS